MRRAKARRVAGQMNRTEQSYADNILDVKLRGGVIHGWMFEAVTLKLADDCRYTPDFMVIEADDTITFVETKGHWRDDAKVKIRVAAKLFPMFRFMAATHHKGVWVYHPFGPGDAAA